MKTILIASLLLSGCASCEVDLDNNLAQHSPALSSSEAKNIAVWNYEQCVIARRERRSLHGGHGFIMNQSVNVSK